MANIYYDIPTNSRFRPYLGAGLGFYTSRINNLTATFFPAAMLSPVNQTSETSFAFQIKAGISYEISPKSEAFLGYRYFNGSTLNFNDPGNLGRFSPDGVRIHAAELGFRYFF
ncbi:outer membrane beta-barrel protein [bacterium]|nr:outer membrane beta-barrel protein [bacterium]